MLFVSESLNFFSVFNFLSINCFFTVFLFQAIVSYLRIESRLLGALGLFAFCFLSSIILSEFCVHQTVISIFFSLFIFSALRNFDSTKSSYLKNSLVSIALFSFLYGNTVISTNMSLLKNGLLTCLRDKIELTVVFSGFTILIFALLKRGLFIKKRPLLPKRKNKLIFISAGEHSGDILGADLILSLSNSDPTLRFMGIGGPLMRQYSHFECILLMENFQYLGFKAVLFSLFKIFKQYRFIKKTLLNRLPDIAVFIDLPDMHLRLEKTLKKNLFPGKIVHYVCPSIWAWRSSRKKTLEDNLDLLLTILPFEKDLFTSENSRLKVKFVGHPLLTLIENHRFDLYWKKQFDIPENRPFIAFFPGSRLKDVEKNFILQLQAFKQSCYQDTHNIIVSYTEESIKHMLEKTIRFFNIQCYFVPSCFRYEMMKEAELITAKCGTIVLECALIGTPTLITCLIGKIDSLVARYVFGMGSSHYGLPNLILDEIVFPEFIGNDTNLLSTQISEYMNFFSQSGAAENLKIKCREIKHKLKTNSLSLIDKEVLALFPNEERLKTFLDFDVAVIPFKSIPD